MLNKEYPIHNMNIVFEMIERSISKGGTDEKASDEMNLLMHLYAGLPAEAVEQGMMFIHGRGSEVPVSSDIMPLHLRLMILLEYLEKVRGRARSNSSDPNVLPKVTTTNQAELRDAIYHERRVELALEYDRYFDLARTGRLYDTMKAYYAKYSGDRSKLEKGKNIQPFHNHMPSPQRAIDASLFNGTHTLEQNPGY